MSHGIHNDLYVPNEADLNDNVTTPSSLSHQTMVSTAQGMLALHQSHGLGVNQNGRQRDQQSSTSSMTMTPQEQETNNEIVSVINISNDLDVEEDCPAITTMVKKCIKENVWPHVKFLTDNSLKKMAITDKNNPHTVINILLSHTRKERLTDAYRFRFWKRYGPMVQRDLNKMKTVCTQKMKAKLMAGMLIFSYYSSCIVPHLILVFVL